MNKRMRISQNIEKMRNKRMLIFENLHFFLQHSSTHSLQKFSKKFWRMLFFREFFDISWSDTISKFHGIILYGGKKSFF